MGYNRGGARRTARLKRRKREENRLLRTAALQASEKPGLGTKVKELAEGVHKVGEVMQAAAEKIKEALH
jgi:hypothetical protein